MAASQLERKLREADPEVYDLILEEMRRNDRTVNLIASENYPPKACMKALSSVLSGIYSEGYPGRRYYKGLENVDAIERLAIERAKALFGAEHANVQALSGANANLAAYLALLEPGDRILSMALESGGHLSHGASVSCVSRIYEVHHYRVSLPSGYLDYDEVEARARQVRPRLIVAGASAYPRTIDFARFRGIADTVGAYLMADISHIAGLVAAGEHPSPVPYCDVVTMTTHKTLRMTRGAIILSKAQHARKVDRAVFPRLQGGPHQANIAAIAVGLKLAAEPEFRAYGAQVVRNAKRLAETLSALGLRLYTGGTDNHLMLVDLQDLDLDGETAATALEEAHIVVNKNKIPGGRGTALRPMGIRLGTPAVTTRGMGEKEMEQVGRWVARVLEHPHDEAVKADVREEVLACCEAFPIYEPTF